MIQLLTIAKFYGNADHPQPVLSDVNLQVARGESVAITGASGSGKSTLLNIIGCLDVATSGTYRLEDEDVSLLDDPARSHLRSQKIGFVFQHFHLIPHLTVLENVFLPYYYAPSFTNATELRARAKALLAFVGLSDRVDHRPNQLSGGEQQRVAIARALLMNPPLLLADEPTGNLDAVTTGQILELFQEISQQGSTLVLVTHDPLVAAGADRTCNLDNGELAA